MLFAINWHESAMDLYVFPIPISPHASLPIPSLWVFPVHQPWAFVSCIQPGLVICFTLDSILVSMLFSQNIPPLPKLTSYFSSHWILFIKNLSLIKSWDQVCDLKRQWAQSLILALAGFESHVWVQVQIWNAWFKNFLFYFILILRYVLTH